MAKRLSSMRIETAKFSRFVRDYSDKCGHVHERTLRRMALSLLNWIIMAWPVLTGRSRAGWGIACRFLGLNIPPPPKPEEAAQGFVPGSVSMTALRFEAVNNVVYAEALEDGWSAQAPAGVVRLAMRRLTAELGGGALPKEILTEYRGVWETGRIPTRAIQVGTGAGL